jgi:O-antigen ligase
LVAPLQRAAELRSFPPRAGVALLAAAALAALIYDPTAPAAVPKTVALSLLSLLLLAASLTRRERTPQGWPTTLWLALCGWSALSLLWGDHPAGGLLQLAAWCAAGGSMLVLHRLEQPRRIELASRLALVVGGAAAAAALLQWLLGARVHGGQGNPNWLGLLLAVTLPICVGAFARKRSALLLLPIALQLAGLLLSGSRVAWFALAVTGLAAALHHGRSRVRWVGGACAVLGLILVVFLAARSGKPLAEAWGGRAQIWRCSAGAALASAPLGVGAGGFAHVFLEEQGELLSTVAPRDAARRFENATTAHNDYLHAAVETGPVGMLLLAAALVLAIAQGLGAKAAVGERKAAGGAAASRALPEPRKTHWPAGAWAVLALALTALGDSPLHQPAVLIVVAVVFPALASGTAWRALSGWPARAVALALVAGLLAPSAVRWLGCRVAAPARDAVLDQRRGILERASSVDRWSGPLALELGLAHLELGRPAEALVELERSQRLLANVGTHVAKGNALLGLGRVKDGVKAYREALAWHPGLFRAHANLAEALRRIGDLDGAARHLRLARSLFPGHPKLPNLDRRLRRSRIERESNELSGD